MRKFALLGLILFACTANAEQWKTIDSGDSITDGKLTISQRGGHYIIKYPGSANPRSASISIDGEVFYGNEINGFSGTHGDVVVKRLLSASEASTSYDDGFRTKAAHIAIDLDSLRSVIKELK